MSTANPVDFDAEALQFTTPALRCSLPGINHRQETARGGGGLPSHHAASLLAAKPLPRSRRHGNVIGTPEMRPSEALFFRSLHSLSTSARRGGQLAGWHVDSIMAAPAQAQWYTHIHTVLTRRRRRTEKHTDTQAGTHTFSLYPRIHIHSSMFFDAPTAPRSSVLHFGVNIV